MKRSDPPNFFLFKSPFCGPFFLAIIIFLAFWLQTALSQISNEQTLNEAISYFNSGDFSKAKDLLWGHLRLHPEDSKARFYLGKIEWEGKQSLEYFDKVSQDQKSEKSGEALLHIIEHSFSRGFHVSSLDLAEKFEKSFPHSPFLLEVLWIRSSSLLALERTEEAQKIFQNIIKKSPNSEWAFWSQLGLGDIYFSKKDYERAIAEYKKVLNIYPESEALPLALFQLSLCYEKLNKDQSLLYRNLYKEKFPEGIQQVEEIVQAEPDVASRKQSPAERIAGISYTIQVGVFGVKENALNQMEKFKKKGYSCKIQEKVIEGKRYCQVLVGKFSSEEKAIKVKEKLEKEENEFYKITLW